MYPEFGVCPQNFCSDAIGAVAGPQVKASIRTDPLVVELAAKQNWILSAVNKALPGFPWSLFFERAFLVVLVVPIGAALVELALDIGVHPVHLARVFRKNFDCTVGEFVRRLRIERACKEIAESSAPISEIALALGFYDQSHFSNTFKRFTGMTPAAYRATCHPG